MARPGARSRPTALSAPTAVEWLADASPKLHTTTESSGHGGVTPSDARRPAEGERQAERPRQVGGDRRGLRDDVEPGVPEHLVAAAGDRVARRGDQPRGARRRSRSSPATWPRAGGVEAAGAVVQQRRVGRPQRHARPRRCSRGRRADRVEASPCALQPADGEVEVAALQLGVEVGQQAFGVWHGRAYLVRSGPFIQPADDMIVDRLGHGARVSRGRTTESALSEHGSPSGMRAPRRSS